MIYFSTALDLIVILMMLFNKYPSKADHRQIFIGQFVGSGLLVLISLFFAYVLHMVPDQWILGILGIIPIYFGIKALISDEEEVETVETKLTGKSLNNLIIPVILITFASCGADNIGLFIPYFVTLTLPQTSLALVIFMLGILTTGLLGNKLAKIKLVENFLDKFGDWIIAIIYIGLGIMIIWESGTIQHFI
ncbi:cadmium resistance protein [Paucilactobacillus oligofermentans DSM 15707 = LMG 22743]|uniref:Cadmium resistance protein n=1 Tax=Paucilactobacillus oligofermentans DSM 15707 = LMG 22743 TaxID=1423778 RepID=A0A0R1RGN3_9LACO|nr:cadmium resistance protein [Paucilactobacillus oligofermentans DSM 15707 = LMG 22743]